MSYSRVNVLLSSNLVIIDSWQATSRASNACLFSIQPAHEAESNQAFVNPSLQQSISSRQGFAPFYFSRRSVFRAKHMNLLRLERRVRRSLRGAVTPFRSHAELALDSRLLSFCFDVALSGAAVPP